MSRTGREWSLHLRIEGPAVAGLQAGFIDMWAERLSGTVSGWL